jgi:DNA polymerase-3 subunit alpha (Gram-positive type)
MSAMDAMKDVGALVARAAEWGHRAVAITDHGVRQGYPSAFAMAEKKGVKVIYGGTVSGPLVAAQYTRATLTISDATIIDTGTGYNGFYQNTGS